MISALLLFVALGAEPITVAEYRDRLIQIRTALERSDTAEVRRLSAALLPARVRYGTTTVGTDADLLKYLDQGAPDAAQAAARLRTLIGSLEERLEAGPEPSIDRALLDRLRREEKLPEINRGGDQSYPEMNVPPSIAERIREALSWIATKIGQVIRWLLRLFFGGDAGKSGVGTGSWVTWLLVFGVAIMTVLVILALRRRRAVRAVAPAQSRAEQIRDEDPLSRSADEWERFAKELMASGSYREAIRAWYHAVLVNLFRAGILHYRKDRTNWEYAYSMTPDVPFRSGFVEATREFEIEWYGRRNTTPETAEAFGRRVREIVAGARRT